MAQTKKQRSEAAKKAAATRKRNQEAEASETSEDTQHQRDVAAEARRRRANSPLDAAEKARKDQFDSEVDEVVARSGQKAEALEYQPRKRPLQAAGLDQHAVEAERQAALQSDRDEHNRRTGDASR